MDKEKITQIRASIARIRRQVSSAREGLKSVRNGMSVFREWMTDMHTINASMVHRIQVSKKKDEIYKAAIRKFYHTPIINAKALDAVRRVNQEMHLMECQISKQGIEHFNLAKPIKPGDLLPYYFYKATAIMHRKN